MFDKVEESFLVKIHLGLVTTAFAVFLGLLQVQLMDFDNHLYILLFCFALTFPFNIYFGFLVKIFGGRNTKSIQYGDRILFKTTEIPSYKCLYTFTVLTVVIASIGIEQLLEHFSSIAGLIFTLGVVALIILCLINLIIIKNDAKKEKNAYKQIDEDRENEKLKK